MGWAPRLHGARTLWLALFVAGALAATTPAFGKSPDMGLIVEKDFATSRLTLHTGVILEVSGATRLLSQKGTRITFTDLQVTDASDGVVVMRGEAMVRYEGRMQGGVVDATMVQVVGAIPR